MQKLSDLEISVSKLSDEEFAEFREWFWHHENERWDSRLEKDIAEGKLSSLVNEALEDYRKGNFKTL